MPAVLFDELTWTKLSTDGKNNKEVKSQICATPTWTKLLIKLGLLDNLNRPVGWLLCILGRVKGGGNGQQRNGMSAQTNNFLAVDDAKGSFSENDATRPFVLGEWMQGCQTESCAANREFALSARAALCR